MQLQGQRRQKYTADSSSPIAYGRNSQVLRITVPSSPPMCAKIFTHQLRRTQGDFFRELTALQSLNHPAILKILDFGARTGLPFLVMPLRAGNLRTIITARHFLPLDDALPILDRIADAIDHAHQRGIIHGDIKPENILSDEDGQNAVVGDFGVSRRASLLESTPHAISTVPPSTARRGGAGRGVGGTFHYLAPEQLASGDQSVSSDIYSFAMVVYEMLTGKLPFSPTAPIYGQLQMKIEGKPLHPIEANPALDSGIADTLLAGLEIEPSARPRTARRLIEMLRNRSSSHRGDSPSRRESSNKKVFVVHGHDEGRKHAVARFIHDLGLVPVILSEMPSSGNTIIEKLESHTDTIAAVAILTADDEGTSRRSNSVRPRARQNVIFELGFLYGKLGRSRTVALFEEGIELPSDHAGIGYVALDSAGAWRTVLAREFHAMGLSVNPVALLV